MKKSRNIKNLRDFLKNRMNIFRAVGLKLQNLVRTRYVIEFKEYFDFF